MIYQRYVALSAVPVAAHDGRWPAVSSICLHTGLNATLSKMQSKLRKLGYICRRKCCCAAPQAHRAHMAQLPCQVVAAVPRQQADEAAAAAGVDPRRHSPFISYAMIAAAEVRRSVFLHTA
jgi:hypothetical protein